MTDIFSSAISSLFIEQFITMTDLITDRNKGSTCPCPVQLPAAELPHFGSIFEVFLSVSANRSLMLLCNRQVSTLSNGNFYIGQNITVYCVGSMFELHHTQTQQSFFLAVIMFDICSNTKHSSECQGCKGHKHCYHKYMLLCNYLISS